MTKKRLLFSVFALIIAVSSALIGFQTPAAAATPISVFGAWHCGNDACTWGTVRSMADFDFANSWLVQGAPGGKPAVNLVILSFVNPLKLLNKTTDPQTSNGVPIGMNAEVINYFKNRGVRVMLSIGGITYVDAWNTALATNATQLGLNTAAVAQQYGVGMEIDYEQSSSPDIVHLQQFIDAYRSVLPYDASGNNPAARLTIDLAAGDRWLIDLTRKATTDWLKPNGTVLDYANAMVPSRQPSASGAISNWQEHLDGKPTYAPPIPSLAPAKFTGSLYIVSGTNPDPECVNFANSITKADATWVQTAAPKNGVGTTSGLLGYMYWAAEKPSTRRITTVPPNSCEGGLGVAAGTFAIPIPMPALRQS